MNDISSSVQEFRFPWELLSDFYATFRRHLNNDTVYNYDCCLSRVHLNDKELVKFSGHGPTVSVRVEDCAELMEGMSVCEHNDEELVSVVDNTTVKDDAPLCGNEAVKQILVKNGGNMFDEWEFPGSFIGLASLELTKDAWSELPKQFGVSKKLEHSKYYKKRKRSFDDAQKWLKSITFEEYWQETASYLIYRTWYEDYGHIMSEDYRIQLAEQVDECKPVALIDAHNEEVLSMICKPGKCEEYQKLSNYFGLSKDVKFSSYEELFALHSELVMKLAREDFELFLSATTHNRCRTFLKKIEKLGFVSGYSDADISTDKEDSPSKSQEVNLEAITRPLKRRFPMTYGEDEAFSDVIYEIYNPRSTSRSLFLKRSKDSTSQKAKVRDEELEEHDIGLGTGDIKSENCNVSSSDFAFDPVKDAHLLAKNAFDAYINDKEIIKYWYQRYRLFSKLDRGILMDREGWFSVTPERIAEHIADRMVRRSEMLIVDGFCGVGGNSIQLALKGARVIAIDLDPIRLKCARENSKVYGVENRIDFICCDFFHFVSKWTHDVGKPVEVDAVFLSPPWGGPSYLNSMVFDLDELTPNGFDIFTAARRLSPNIAYFLPRNAALKQLISLSGPGGRCEIEQNCLNDKIKTLTAYYGNLAVQRSE